MQQRIARTSRSPVITQFLGSIVVELQDILSKYFTIVGLHSIIAIIGAYNEQIVLHYSHKTDRPSCDVDCCEDWPIRRIQCHLHLAWVLHDACLNFNWLKRSLLIDKKRNSNFATTKASPDNDKETQSNFTASNIVGWWITRLFIPVIAIQRSRVPTSKWKRKVWSIEASHTVWRHNSRRL